MPVHLHMPRSSSRHGWIHDDRMTRTRSVAAELKEIKSRPTHKLKLALNSEFLSLLAVPPTAILVLLLLFHSRDFSNADK